MAKYTQEVKDKAVEAAKTGMNLKEIQRTIGPNPKATQRYLVKAGINFKDLQETLRAEGKLKPATRKQGNHSKSNASKASKETDTPTEEVIEE